MTVHNSLRACERKIAFDSYKEALEARESLRKARKMKPGLRPYVCDLCGKYHLGCPSRWMR